MTDNQVVQDLIWKTFTHGYSNHKNSFSFKEKYAKVTFTQNFLRHQKYRLHKAGKKHKLLIQNQS